MARVPSEPVVEVVLDYLSRQEDDTNRDGQTNDGPGMAPLARLALRCDMKEDTLRSILFRGKKTIDFDIADLLLCRMNRVDVWRGALSDVYYEVDLNEPNTYKKPARVSRTKVCEADECAKEFIPRPRAPHRKYCSNACKRKMWLKRRREREGAKPRFGTRYGHCPNGHERTPEDTYVRANGSIACKACGREKEAERYRNDPEYRQRRIEASRRRREELRHAA